VSFAAPLVLLGLLVLPGLIASYVLMARRRREVLRAFVSEPLLASPAPNRPGFRRHVPYVLFALALAVLIVAAARPRHTVSEPVKGATVMLANDVSDSMQSRDVDPSRLSAAKRAALTFLDAIPATVQAGSIKFARHVTLLQSPTTDHQLTADAINSLSPGGGGTAIGDAIETALAQIRSAPKIAGTRPPGAIVVLSDGTSNVGASPIVAAQQAKADHVKIYTVAIGTSHGTITGLQDGKQTTIPVPVSPQELAQIASVSGGHTYRAVDAASAKQIYTQLARTLGHRNVNKSLVGPVAGAGLLLLVIGAGLSLLWFSRLA
jgi:Ca-activated chloride channel homolog